MIQLHLRVNYFSFVYQSFYNQIGYDNNEKKRFTSNEFQKFVINTNFLDLINEIYRTRLSKKGIKIISERLQEVEHFDDYYNAISIFEACNPTKYANGNLKSKNAFSFGTKVLHFYDPKHNPILDSEVRKNLGIKVEMNKSLCIEFREAANSFVKKHRDYFDKFYESDTIAQELEKRHMNINFSNMEILDMALYEPENKLTI
ncbi:hypothetical protein SAMN04488587_2007 [Methanococcoides vulcani]|uniref:Uncharacterized protein n=2 Tax=Methanococcoides vulcani TaxID=1353158 RepID=A0A1I0B6D6_9EURY|nr:hypothetical protein SAMN04488587_2007 [Methanococcoides vulcani]